MICSCVQRCDDSVSPAAVPIAAGPRSPQPGAPYTYVTTDGFLSRFGFNSLRDLPDFEKLEDAGLLSKLSKVRNKFFLLIVLKLES